MHRNFTALPFGLILPPPFVLPLKTTSTPHPNPPSSLLTERCARPRQQGANDTAGGKNSPLRSICCRESRHRWKMGGAPVKAIALEHQTAPCESARPLPLAAAPRALVPPSATKALIHHTATCPTASQHASPTADVLPLVRKKTEKEIKTRMGLGWGGERKEGGLETTKLHLRLGVSG